jgi:hypothetical protein
MKMKLVWTLAVIVLSGIGFLWQLGVTSDPQKPLYEEEASDISQLIINKEDKKINENMYLDKRGYFVVHSKYQTKSSINQNREKFINNLLKTKWSYESGGEGAGVYILRYTKEIWYIEITIYESEYNIYLRRMKKGL